MIDRKTRGFTLIEMTLIAALLGVVITAAIVLLNPVGQMQKAQDAKRKSDLAQLQRSIELYYQDNGRYPATITFGGSWMPYLQRVPNDPNPANRYAYTSSGQSYYLYASLERGANDPQACNGGARCTNAASLNCGGVCNYGVSSPNVSP